LAELFGAAGAAGSRFETSRRDALREDILNAVMNREFQPMGNAVGPNANPGEPWNSKASALISEGLRAISDGEGRALWISRFSDRGLRAVDGYLEAAAAAEIATRRAAYGGLIGSLDVLTAPSLLHLAEDLSSPDAALR